MGKEPETYPMYDKVKAKVLDQYYGALELYKQITLSPNHPTIIYNTQQAFAAHTRTLLDMLSPRLPELDQRRWKLLIKADKIPNFSKLKTENVYLILKELGKVIFKLGYDKVERIPETVDDYFNDEDEDN